MNHTFISILSIVASFFTALSMTVYVYRLFKNGSIPNPATWIIWMVIGYINLMTYFLIAKGSLLQAAPLVFVMIGISTVVVYSLLKGKFSQINGLDKVCFALSVLVGAIWQFTGDPQLANLILQVVYAISFFPTIIGLSQRRLQETMAPWGFSLIAYALMIAVVILDWSNQSWVALAHPIVNGLIGNGLVFLFAWLNKNYWLNQWLSQWPSRQPIWVGQ